MWGGGRLSDNVVWSSVRYEEKTYDLGGRVIRDAKAFLPSGKCSRTVGVTSESVGYVNVDCDSAGPLDRLLDSVCITPDASKHLFP